MNENQLNQGEGKFSQDGLQISDQLDIKRLKIDRLRKDPL